MMIYGYALGNRGYVVATKQNKKARAPGLELLEVSKQLNFELTNMIRDTKSCRLDFGHVKPDGHCITAGKKAALRLFRRIEISVSVYPVSFSVDPSSDGDCKLLYRVVQHVAKARKKIDRQARLSIHLDSKLVGWRAVCLDKGKGVFDADQCFSGDYKYNACYYAAQFRCLACKLQLEVQKSLPNTSITTNASIQWPGIRVERLSDSEVEFVDVINGRRGMVISAHHELLHTVVRFVDYADGSMVEE